jgi:hypothetical protein
MPIRRSIPLSVTILLVAGCVSPEDPYLLTTYLQHQNGVVEVCYDEATAKPEQVRAVAEDVCHRFERVAEFELTQQYQCSWTTPTMALFHCVARPGETPPAIKARRAPLRRSDQGG